MHVSGRYCVDALMRQLAQQAAVDARAEDDARDAARTLATAAEKREDARAVLEFGSLAKGHAGRARRAREELEILAAFRACGIPAYVHQTPIGLGAIVDVATDDEEGYDERTYVLLPVGAGTELSGPGGDGFLVVITPQSPVGKALMGRRVGDVVDVTVRGDIREWSIMAVG